ncbi:MAG: hypothetical protein GXP62_01020 [Oligoflexia bacterium]|nr:hypothetical protein [Oligoflexia bacterium]
MIFSLDMMVARTIARKYNLDPGEDALFAWCWKLLRRASQVSKAHVQDMQAEVEAAYGRITRLVQDHPAQDHPALDHPALDHPVHGPDHLIVRRRPTMGTRYVIFSDHHWTVPGHRMDFFGHSGNRDLYVEVLRRYLDQDHVLVENGDVEELLVDVPSVDDVRARLKMTHKQLNHRRQKHRLALLKRILNAPELGPLYDTLATFQSRGRLVRVAGNHDIDLQLPKHHAALAERIPGLLRPCDYLLLQTPSDGPGGPRTDFVIAHGHQLDRNTNARFASQVGETISETISWAFQGADRTWAWDDDVAPWALGQDFFPGDLVDATFDHGQCEIINALGMILGILHSRDAWESLFKHNIAWEYFEHRDPQQVVDLEVRTGDEFFKFRHLDEFVLKAMLHQHFSDQERPTLVLGHTHEPRLFTAPTAGESDERACPWYINSGSAGRFENLIWAVEIDDGKPRLVSWSRPRPKLGEPQRRVWRHATQGGHNRLWAT